MGANRDIKHYRLGDDKEYEFEWSKAVLTYLEKGYSEEGNNCEVEIGNDTYKILKRDSVTAFYDADGNTLFDVENERLKEEYEAIETLEETEPQSEIGKAIAGIEKQAYENAVIPMGTASLADIVTGNIPKPTQKEIDKAMEEMANTEEGENNEPTGNGIDEAVKKLQGELKRAKEEYAEPILAHMIERCRESETLANAVCQNHKTWEKCFKYIVGQASKCKKGNCAMVKDSVVYEWAEDYYRLDDKALEEKKAKEAEERKNKQKKESKKLDAVSKRAQEKAKEKTSEKKPTVTEPKKSEKKEAPKKRSNELEGQMDLFSMMGL